MRSSLSSVSFGMDRDPLHRAAGSFFCFLLLLVATIVVAVPSDARAAEITEQYQYYEVSGHSLGEANELMFMVSPVVSNGETFAAGCYREVTWQYTTAPGRGLCTLGSATLSITITYTMPRWTGYSEASPSAQEQWDRFFRRLLLHEEGHARIAKDAVRKAEQELQGLTRPSCRELNEAIDEKHARFVKRLKALNAEYDARTGHGDFQYGAPEMNTLIASDGRADR